MDSFELNKVLGAVLGTCLALLSLNIAAGSIFAVHEPAKPGFEIAVQEQEPTKPGQAAPAEQPLPQRLADASIKRGESQAKKCEACHTLGKGEPNRVGPNLYGVVGRPKHSEPGFNYSDAMKAQKGNWTPEDLDKFLTSPQKDIPGTRMTFAGLPRGKDRADVIAFLNSNSANPVQFPKVAAAPAAEKQAGGEKSQGGEKPAAAPQQGGKPAAPAKAPDASKSSPAPAEAPKAK